ncbi:hypothetical protein LT493_11780 [Streptomyces tricolor]|nr:hypothetical protein [Streptomyces tricolor]
MAAEILPAFDAQGLVLSVADAGRLKITGYRGYRPEVIACLDGLPLDTGITPAGKVIATGVPSPSPTRTRWPATTRRHRGSAASRRGRSCR